MWRTPKTDWHPDDFFNLEDYRRIKENLEYLQGYAYHLYPTIEMQEMRAFFSRQDLPRAYDFNHFEENLERINFGSFSLDIGDTLEYEPGGQTIDADEVNRIEEAILQLYFCFKELGKTQPRLPLVLGRKNMF